MRSSRLTKTYWPMAHLRGLGVSSEDVLYYAKHNIEVQPENILVTTGASEAIIMTLIALPMRVMNSLFQNPFMPIMTPLQLHVGVKVIPVSSTIDTIFRCLQSMKLK